MAPPDRARQLLSDRTWAVGGPDEREAHELMGSLRQAREFELLVRVGERLLRRCPENAGVRCHVVQGLIENGLTQSAIDVARAGLVGISNSNPEWSELHGLIGRACKQVVVDAGDRSDSHIDRALRDSIEAYAVPYRLDPSNTWHAINLVAVLRFSERVLAQKVQGWDATAIADEVITRVSEKTAIAADPWDLATLAEAYLAKKDMPLVQITLKRYLANPKITAFHVGSTLRQFSEVWGLTTSNDPDARGLLQALRARALQLPGAQLRLSPDDVVRQRLEGAEQPQLQAILGPNGTQSYEWWQLGLERASSVGAVYAGPGRRFGTCFLVKAKDMGIGDSEELLALTNSHVVSVDGAGGALRPADAEVVFEAGHALQRCPVESVVRSSSIDRHDSALLKLHNLPSDLEPIPIAANLPVRGESRVYIIGHLQGGGLEFSFQDNELIDHEGPEEGKPPIKDVWRMHYRAPTEKGSSGSPVFNGSRWQAIALHRAVSESRLNGVAGTYASVGERAANEGVALRSIITAWKNAASS